MLLCTRSNFFIVDAVLLESPSGAKFVEVVESDPWAVVDGEALGLLLEVPRRIIVLKSGTTEESGTGSSSGLRGLAEGVVTKIAFRDEELLPCVLDG